MVSAEMNGHLFRIWEMFAALLVAIFQGPEVIGIASTSAVEEQFAPSRDKHELVFI